MSGQLRVIPDDLRKFHVDHFGNIPHQNAIIGSASEPKVHVVEDLGSYPDGVLRTLTDDEIAWFRAAEIRKLEMRTEEEQSYRSVLSSNKADEVDHKVSTAELPANAPLQIKNKQALYDELFGSFSTYQQNLDQYNDEEFAKQSRKLRVVSYYPAVSLRLS